MFVCCECCVLSLVQRSPTDCSASLFVIKKPRTRGDYSPDRGLQNTNPEKAVAPVKEIFITNINNEIFCSLIIQVFGVLVKFAESG